MDKSGFEVNTCAKMMPKTWEFLKKHIKEVIYSLPQAPFRKNKMFKKSWKISEFLENHETCHLFFAAGAFSQKENVYKILENIIISRISWKNMNNHEQSWTISYSLCRRRLFAKKFLENHETCHLFFAAGAFTQKRCSTNHEKYENF